MYLPGFNARKAAQVAAFFAIKAGGSISRLKITKLIYLADRRFMSEYDEPILFDKVVAMPHGPVNSYTQDLLNGSLRDDDWERFVARAGQYDVDLVNAALSVAALDELSEAEVEALEATWAEFGHMTKYDIRDYTHTDCAEWKDPKGSSIPIEYSEIFKALGKSNINELAEHIEEVRNLDQALLRV